MPEPIQFQSQSPRFALPFLFAGQAQKEFFLNEALARLDALVHPAIEAELAVPPTNPAQGTCWLAGESASGEWAGHDGKLASREAGDWLFLEPLDGMRVWDRATSQQLLFLSGTWHRIATPDSPGGGATVDAEARAAIDALIEALRNAGIFASA